MYQVKLHYTLQYIKCELADERVENKPVLRMYYDTHFHRTEDNGGIHTLHLDEHDTSKQYKGILKAETLSVTGKIPGTACIGMAQYAQRRNEYDMACYTNAGTTHLRIDDIYDALHVKKQAQYVQEKPLLMETTKLMGDPIRKGIIRFTCTKLEMGKKVNLIQAKLCPLGAPIGKIDDMIESFLKRRIQFENNMVDTWPGIKNVRAPMDISSAGGELTQNVFVPIEGFAIEEPFVTNVGYFQNAYEQVMKNKNLNPETDWNAMDRVHKAETMAEVCCFAAQSFDYISDTVDENKRATYKPIGDLVQERHRKYDISLVMGFEDFNNMGTTGSGDCEDGDKLIQVIFGSLQDLDTNTKDASVPIKEMHEISQHYTFFMSLATVHGAKAEDQTEHIGAHMYGMLVPSHQVRNALLSNELGTELLSKLPLEDHVKSAGLPTLFCEGTGKIRPLGPGPVMTVGDCVRSAAYTGELTQNHPRAQDPLIIERQLVGIKMKSKGGLKTEIPHDYGAPSNFYLGNLLFVTDRWLKLGYNIGAFICGNIDKQQQAITRGAKFVDIVNQLDTFALVPCEPIPQAIMDVTREAVSLRAPSLPFTFDPKKPVRGLVKNPDLERLKDGIAKLNRRGSSPYGSVDIFMRDHQFNRASISRMIKDLQQIGSLYKVDYEMEPITNKIHTYRVQLFIDAEGAKRDLNQLIKRNS